MITHTGTLHETRFHFSLAVGVAWIRVLWSSGLERLRVHYIVSCLTGGVGGKCRVSREGSEAFIDLDSKEQDREDQNSITVVSGVRSIH